MRSILRFFPRTEIGNCPSLGPLMIRWHILRFDKVALLVHCFLRNDDDRAVHDHPWSFITIPFQSYVEHHHDGTQSLVRAFRPHFRPAEYLHWVEVQRPQTWTLVLRFKRRRQWGFMTNSGWVHWKNFGGGCE